MPTLNVNGCPISYVVEGAGDPLSAAAIPQFTGAIGEWLTR
jgi:hypothetical protein